MTIPDSQTTVDFPPDLIERVETPCYLISEDVIKRNCALLDTVQKRTGCKILMALKAFALPVVFPIIREYLHGVCASGPVEAQLGRQDFNREVHTYAPAFSHSQMERVAGFSDHIIFNSISQWKTHEKTVHAAGRDIEIGLRVNPGHAEVEVDLYNPCLPGSRFGINPGDLDGTDMTGISGLHFHALCEQGADVLVRVLESFEKRFACHIANMKWINFGGGHHITRGDYDINLLCETITGFKKRHDNIDVYLEPGEAVVLNSGVFVTQVLDIIHNEIDIAIVDSSAETHMPDVLAMPYRPHIVGSGMPRGLPYTYRLGGISCLAGDVIGDYSFAAPLHPGNRLVLTDMALYSFVKNNTFNGVELPAIYTCSSENNSLDLLRRFSFDDYRGRLA